MFKAVKIREGHDNFFTPLRLLFAALVVIGHAYMIGLRDAGAEPRFFRYYTFSYVAVNLFFIVSGFLVTKSMLYRRDKAEFISSRLLRIYPALIIHVFFMMLVIGPLATSLPLGEYFSDMAVWMQPALVLPFIETEMNLPGIFAANNEQFGSAPLWTLRYEMMAYMGTVLVFTLGLMRKKWMVLLQFIIPAVIWAVLFQSGNVDNLPGVIKLILRFGIAYGLGAAIYAYRERLKFHFLVIPVLIALTLIFDRTMFFEIIMNVMLAYIVMWAAYVKAPKLNFLQKLSDVSYSLYIYHWCVLQLVFMWLPEISALGLLAIGLPTAFLLATLSWHIIEKPMLTKKTSFAKFLRFGREAIPKENKSALLD